MYVPKKQKLHCPQPCLPDSANTQPTGILAFHPSLSPGLTSRSLCQAHVCLPPRTPSTCYQTSSSAETPGASWESEMQSGRENFHPHRGSGLKLEPLPQAICLKLSIPWIFRDQRNGLLCSESYANVPPDILFVRVEKHTM